MTQFLRLNLLGVPQILVEDQLVSGFATAKAQALLFYLAVMAQKDGTQPSPQSRDAVATLLWGEMTDKKAKQNLRTVLSDLRRLVGDHLIIDRQTVAFNLNSPHWLDVQVLRRDLSLIPSLENLSVRQTAVSLYNGEFLSGFSVHNAPEFEAWVMEQRQKLHILVVQALFSLVDEQLEREDFAAALAANHQLLGLEPWSEPVHRQQMLLLARLGERSKALAQFELCQKILAEEFGVEPLPETFALYDQIKAGKTVSQREVGQNETKRPSARQQIDQAPAVIINERDLPQRIELFGREKELERLQKWLLLDNCRLVGIFGIGGQGKSTLAVALARALAQPDKQAVRMSSGPGGHFTHINWKSLLNAPPLTEVLQEWVYALSEQTITTLPESPDQQWKLLLDYLQSQRCLLILDNLESILQGEKHSGEFMPGYEEYGRFLHYLADVTHQSCILITSRERPINLAPLEDENPAVRFLSLTGLPAEAGNQMLTARGISGDPSGMDDLVRQYSGNPLALKLAADTVQAVFQGSVTRFLRAEAVVFDDVRHMLDQQFIRLTPIERELMIWLAVLREPVSYNDLRALLAQPPVPRITLEAVRSLLRRSLVEIYEGGFGLQNVVLEYCTDHLVENVVEELVDKVKEDEGHLHLKYTNCVALILAQAKEYVRASQTRLLLQPVADQLIVQLGAKKSEQRLKQLLSQLQLAPLPPGYAAANLLHLLLHLQVDLRGYDFSGLYFRQLFLRGVSLPHTNLAQTKVLESVFTEPFGIVNTAVFSPDGRFVAAGTNEGTLYIWYTTDQQIFQVIQAHKQPINEIAFVYHEAQPHARRLLLASASGDRTVGLWSLAEGEAEQWHTRLTHEEQNSVLSVGFQAGGRRLLAVDGGGQVFVWDIERFNAPKLIERYTAVPPRLGLVDYSDDGKTVAVGAINGTVQVRQGATGALNRELTIEAEKIRSLALSNDGRLLVTGDKEGSLCFWALPEGKLVQVIKTSPFVIDALAISANGKFLASTHGVGDHAVRIWALGADSCWHLRHTLLGHTHVIWSVTFGPTPEASMISGVDVERHMLVTGSSDQTVRVWDVETGQLLYTRRGQPRALSAIAMRAISKTQSLPSQEVNKEQQWLLATVGYDRLVHLWTGAGSEAVVPSRTLSGTKKAFYSVAISPDGRIIAAAGHDKLVYLWDIATGQLLRTLQSHTNSIYRITFHPNGALLASGSTDGTVHLWSLTGLRSNHGLANGDTLDQPIAVLQGNAQNIFDIAFSHDGTYLTAVGSGQTVRMWDISQNCYPELPERSALESVDHNFYSVAFSPDGAVLAGGSNRQIYLWNLHNDEPPRKLRHHTASIFSLAFSPDSAILASSSPDCTICLWDVAKGALRTALEGHTDTVYEITFSPDGAYVVSCSFDGTIKYWDVQSGECVNTLLVDGPYAGMNITGMRGVTEAQKAALQALGAVEA